MAKKLYVGNLSFTCTEQEVHDYFSQVGPVDSVKIIMDRQTGRSKGFGFVEMGNDGDADAAVEKLNGQKFNDRVLTVSEARPREEGGPSRGGGGFRGGSGDRGGFRGGRGGGGGRGGNY